MAQDAFAYRAFISYSHADKACADWLHRELESYRIPSKLVGTQTGIGEVPARLAPIFRDRDELPAAGDLSDELHKALQNSRFLIVIASPAAAQSRWVDEEARQFKRMHGEGSVLALIADGVPGDAGSEAFFPPSLRFKVDAEGARTHQPAEPIAADLREHGDGKRLAKLKLVAGLTGLPLDALVQREAARRQRRLTAVAVLAGVLAVSMSVLALMAVRGQAEAERQRAEADGLVEFMLTDLRAKLEPVGRLEIFDAVGQRALDYYSRQDLKALDADALGRRARALHLVGEVRELRGDSEGALASFQAAGDTTAELLARHPGDAKRIFDHAQSVFWIGYIAWQRNQVDVAERQFRTYDELASELVAIDPDNGDWQAEKSSALTNLGVLLNHVGRHAEAAGYFRKSLEMSQALAAADPGSRDRQREVGQAHAWLADVLAANGDFAAARAERESELAVYASLLAGDPLDAKAREGEAVAFHHLADLGVVSGDYALAARLARAGHDQITGLREQDPENRLWQDIGVSLANRNTEALMLAGDWDGAAAMNALALEEALALVATDPTVASWRTSGLMGARWMQVALDFHRAGREAGRAGLLRFHQDFAADREVPEGGSRAPWVMVLAMDAMDLHHRGETVAARERIEALRLMVPAEPQPREKAVLEFLEQRTTPSDSPAPPRNEVSPAPLRTTAYDPGALLDFD